MRARRLLRTTKLYADLVTEDGTVCVAYLLRSRGPGFRRVVGGVELYRPGSEVRVTRALRAVDPDEVRDADGRLAVAMQMPDGGFTLRYGLPSRPVVPPGPDPVPGLRWSIEVARSPAVAAWRGGGGATLRGEGYADRVEVEGLPRRLGLEAIVWGRAHAHDVAGVFTGIRSTGGHEWRRAAVWPRGRAAGGSPEWVDDFLLDARADGWDAVLGDGDVALRASPGRVLQAGALVDRRRAPGRLERLLLRAGIGPGEQLRRLDPLVSSANGSAAGPGTGGWLLHELVAFGQIRRGDRASLGRARTVVRGGPRCAPASPNGRQPIP